MDHVTPPQSSEISYWELDICPFSLWMMPIFSEQKLQ